MHTHKSLLHSLSLGWNIHVCLCPHRNIQSLNMPPMPVIKLETVLPWQRCLRHSPRWQPPASPCTHPWIHIPNTHTHTHKAGAWAGEISAHQTEAHWPAYCCFKAPINFPLISAYRWGRRERLQMPCQSNKRWKHLRPTLLPFSGHSNRQWTIVMAFLKSAIRCYLKVAASWDDQLGI